MDAFIALVVTIMFSLVPEQCAKNQRSSEWHPLIKQYLFKPPKHVKLAEGTKHQSKFLEPPIHPVKYWNPPDMDVEELYYNNRAVRELNEGLLKSKGFTDTDLIMQNRWNGHDEKENLWEADMILTAKQRQQYTMHGNVYGNSLRLMPDFSEPWPGGNVEYFYENEGPVELFDDLQAAMHIWELAVGCVRFTMAEGMKNFSTRAEPVRPPSYATDNDTAGNNYEETTTTSSTRATDSNDAVGSPKRQILGTSHLLRVTVGDGCYATVGWRPWNRLVIAEHCSLGVLVHLLGHVLGLPHEHSKPERVFHVRVHPQNVHARDFMYLNAESGGERCAGDSAAGWYALRSAMHLDAFGLSASNMSSMSARDFPETARMGANWRQPSHSDALRLRQAGAYGCQAVPPADCGGAAAACVGRVGPDCRCVVPAECRATVAPRGGCSADVRVGAPHTGGAAEQMSSPAGSRTRTCAWLLRAGDKCGRVRLTLTVRMEEAARVAAVAVGCAPLRVESLDTDVLDGGKNVSSTVCLGDFGRWRPAGQQHWLAEKVLVSTSPQLRLLIKRYPAQGSDPSAGRALSRVVASFRVRIEKAVDKYCHCKLADQG